VEPLHFIVEYWHHANYNFEARYGTSNDKLWEEWVKVLDLRKPANTTSVLTEVRIMLAYIEGECSGQD
jgi:hypothetical protein